MDELPAIALDCYRSAIRNVAFYAIELDKDVTAAYRQALSQLENCAGEAAPEALPALLRDYHARATAYVGRLYGEMQQTADNLSQILDSLADSNANYDDRIRNALARLRAFADSPDGAGIRAPLLAAAIMAQEGIEEVRRRQESAVARLMSEIRSLHKKIDSLESASSLDILSALLTRTEMEERLQFAPRGAPHLLLKASGLRLAESRFGNEVTAQLTAAFLKRLLRSLPAESAVARWSEEEFMALVPVSAEAEIPSQELLGTQLSGSYGCSQGGKSVRPPLNVRVTGYRKEAMAECPIGP